MPGKKDSASAKSSRAGEKVNGAEKLKGGKQNTIKQSSGSADRGGRADSVKKGDTVTLSGEVTQEAQAPKQQTTPAAKGAKPPTVTKKASIVAEHQPEAVNHRKAETEPLPVTHEVVPAVLCDSPVSTTFENSGDLDFSPPDRESDTLNFQPPNVIPVPLSVTAEMVAIRAYHIWEARGRVHGFREEDWRRAEYELQAFFANSNL